jgi:protein TonB
MYFYRQNNRIMELKKSPKADLEKKRSLFTQIGLVVALALVLAAFEYSIAEKTTTDLGALTDMTGEEEIIPVTRQEEIKPPPPPPPPQVTEVLNIVDDKTVIENEVDIANTETDDKEVIVPVTVKVEEEEEDPTVFFIVEDMPIFRPEKNKTKEEGEADLRAFIAETTKYPEIARENGISGRVFVQFVINSKGMVTNVEVVRGVDPSLDKEAIRVVQSLPKFAPGKQRGKPVKVTYTVPINFKLG